MNRRRIVEWILLVGILIDMPGCGDSGSPTDSDGAKPLPERNQPATAKSHPTDAAGALRTVVDGIRQNRPTAIWDFLPASHQREINGLAREFATRMDGELWQKTAGVARDSAGLLKKRKQSFLSHPVMKQSEWAADGTLSQKWDGFVALLETVAGSELSDLEKMKTFDGEEFFERFDADALAQLVDLSILLGDDNPFSMLREMIDGAEIEVLKSSGKQSTVGITPPQGETRAFEFVLVNGKWLPKSWAEELIGDIRQAKSRFDVELAPAVLTQKKKQVMPYLDDAQEVIAALQAAETEEAFHATMTERVIKPALLVGGADSGTETAPVDLATQAGEAVTITISRELTASEVEEIADALLSSKGTDRELTEESSDGRTQFVVSPVKDLAAFAKSITFGNVTNVDGKTRTIVVDVPE